MHRFLSYDVCLTMLSAMVDSLGKQSGQTEFNGISDQETSFTYPVKMYDSSGQEQIRHVTCRVAKTVPERVDDIHVVIRVLELSEPLPIDTLGMTQEQVDMIRKHITKRMGAVITSGPMGSGKTVTMTSALNEVSDDYSVHTIEDPIEVRFNRFNFTQNQLKKDHERQLALVLRQNVSALYVGEIRDSITAKAFFKHIKTGHLGAATTHANSAMGVIPRLMDLGVPKADLATSGILSLMMAQRLEKLNCEHCKIQVTAEDFVGEKSSELKSAYDTFKLSTDDKIFMRNEEGCDHKGCHNGQMGRQLLIEMIEVDSHATAFIKAEDWVGWDKHLEETGFNSLARQTKALLLEGKLCPIEAQKALTSK